jgi:iron uptake system EfeUOB component EfeO/EfeM
MHEPGVDRHDWESQWESLEEDVRVDPTHALPELDELVARMLSETGYDLTDPVACNGGEREVVAEYLAAHEILEAAERDSAELSPGDIAAAVNGYRAVFDHLVATRGAIDSRISLAEEA